MISTPARRISLRRKRCAGNAGSSGKLKHLFDDIQCHVLRSLMKAGIFIYLFIFLPNFHNFDGMKHLNQVIFQYICIMYPYIFVTVTKRLNCGSCFAYCNI